MRELGLVLAAAGAGVLVVAVVVLGPTIASAQSSVEPARVVEVLQPAAPSEP
jgi:hypothetical protein